MDKHPQAVDDVIRAISAEIDKGQFNFPTSSQVAFKLRRQLADPDLSFDAIVRLVQAEPLLAAKVVAMANSAMHNTSGRAITDLRSALVRLGVENVRTLATTLALQQLVRSEKLAAFRNIAQALWRHSINVAALAYVLARRFLPDPRRADEALFAGIVHDIGQFYLLSRAADFPRMLDTTSKLGVLMFSLHKSVGRAVLESMGVPFETLDVIDNHDVYGGSLPPSTLADVLFCANEITPCRNPLSRLDEAEQMNMRDAAAGTVDDDLVRQCVEESAHEVEALLRALGS
ncbi:MAG: HDOD domain-containing protein [Rhodocyclaceae bacterium]|nr:HDOD domain-containing protein [Rhodocyclaceae bacterium]MBX3670574.1 HDOD domain-containing protein [Rhodocyclaceae bacterium]